MDFHEASQQFAILDYKTGQNAKQMKDALTTKGEWKDLQLPLYRFIGNQNSWPNAKVGYINLPSRFEDTKFLLADWGDDQFQSALNAAKAHRRCCGQSRILASW